MGGADVTPNELVEETLRLSKLLDAALAYELKKAREWAELDTEYRKAHATAWLNHDGPQGDKKARADLDCADEMYRAHLADGEHRASIEAVRSRRAQISAMQSLMNVIRAEAELAKFGPDLEPG